MNTLYTTAAALVIGLACGAFTGYRYAEGRAAVEREAENEFRLKAAHAVVEQTRNQIDAALQQAAAAARKNAVIDTRQTKERNEYVRATPAPDCQLDDSTYRLLLDAIRRANSGDAAHDSD
ncbi:MAG: hypothetical protein FWH15_09540 [Betaproteobacteria bacterium]|nr:hypothetical protein [Betaproteobacteria bacterium]